ncbi:MAG: hypothetical protein ABUL62_09255 [Myxococcales bacterium]
MRCVSRLLSVVFLVAGHAVAAEPGAVGAPPKVAPAEPAKPAPVAPKTPAPAAPASAAPPAPAPAAAAPKAGDAPPSQYYVEPGFAAPPPGATPPPASAAPDAPPSAGGAPAAPPGPPPPPPAGATEIYEPPPPGFFPGDPVFEPQPLPEPHHLAPRTSLWAGARLGWFVPFGSAFARGGPVGSYGDVNLKGVPWRDYVSSGPMFEIDLGARLSRNYNVFALWEHAELGSGRGDPDAQSPTGASPVGKSKSGDTDFWGVGIRATSDPDYIGFVTELAIGYRRARAKYDGEEIQFTDAPFEARLGMGAEFRLNRVVSLSPMVTIGVGSFGTIDRVSGNTIADHTQADDQMDGHAWATFTIGGSFDVLSSKR